MSKTIQQVEDEMAKLEGERTAIKMKLRLLEKERDQLIVKAKLDAMPESQREAFIIVARSIESGEKFGNIGK